MARVLGNLGARLRLSMFPTPALGYFVRCARNPRCKPHLAAISRELFGEQLDSGEPLSAGTLGGAVFTRFMLAGFATYRALQSLGVTAFESYPYLQFRLYSASTPLPPKGRRAEAIAVRRVMIARLAVEAGIPEAPEPANLDQADAAVLALAAARTERTGALAAVSDRCEGSFMVALDSRQALQLGLEDCAS